MEWPPCTLSCLLNMDRTTLALHVPSVSSGLLHPCVPIPTLLKELPPMRPRRPTPCIPVCHVHLLCCQRPHVVSHVQVDLTSETANCGGCGNVCSTTDPFGHAICVNGACGGCMPV